MMELEGDITALQPTAVCSYWKEFDLESLRGALDEQGLKVAEHQEASVKTRKALAERTKEFKKTVGADVMKAVAPLLKSYQEEVDRLTSRSKHGEGAFLDIYKRLYEAPDPAPVLATALEFASKAAELESEVSKLSRELDEFKAESKELKNQDLTIRRLEERIRGLESDLEEKDKSLEEALKGAQADTEQRLAEEAQQREERLQVELTAAQAALETLRRSHQETQSELFTVQERSGEEAASARAAAERAEEEVERAQDRVARLEKEREMLLQKMQKEAEEQQKHQHQSSSSVYAMNDGLPLSYSSSSSAAEATALREELRAQRTLASKLQSELTTLQERASSNAAHVASQISQVKSELTAKEAHCAALEAELSSRPTPNELEEARQQIRILKTLVHGSVDDDEDSINSNNGAGASSPLSATAAGGAGSTLNTKFGLFGSVEAALLSKSRHLEHKLTMTRLELAEARGDADTANSTITELEGEIKRQQELIRRLEDDLLAAEDVATSAAGLANRGGHQTRTGTLQDSGATDNPLYETSTTSTSDGIATSHGKGSEEESMIAVLCAQRDRFRARVSELELSVAALKDQITKSRADTEAARADNIALVERLKYVQGYSGGRHHGKKVGGGDIEAGGGEVVGKYMKEYEERMNPFTDFQAREKEARRKQMPLQDRAAYALSSLLSGNRTARSVVLVYAMLLHFGIFLLLAGFSHKHTDKIEALEELCAKAAGGRDILPGESSETMLGGLGRMLFQ